MEKEGGNRFSLKRSLFGKINRKLILGFLVIALIPLIIMVYINFTTANDILIESTLRNVKDDVILHGKEMTLILDSFRETVLFLSNTPPINGIIRARDNGGIDPVEDSTYEQWTDRLAIIFEEMAKSNSAYMQIRYIDEEGNELVRIDSESSIVKRIPKDKLQNKADRYYFIDTMKLYQGDLFVSALDLNRERGEVEVPYKPVIRYAVPVFDENSNRRGIVITNIFANSILKTFHLVSSEKRTEGREEVEEYLTDKQGFYLIHPNESKRWGSPGDLDTGENLKKDFTDNMVSLVLSGKSNTMDMKEHGHIVANTPVFPDKENKEEFLVILELIPRSVVLAPVFFYRTILLIIGFVFLVLAATAGFYFSRSISRPIEKLHYAAEQIEKGNFKVRTDIKTGDELEELGNTFNKTIDVLRKTDEDRKQIDKVKTEFLSITSHELRSPMTPMKAQLQMLYGEYYGKLNKKQKEAIDIVIRNASRLDNIIVDFLEISRIEAARLKFNFVKTELIRHINRLVEEMKGFMPEKNVEIVSNIGKLPVIDVDPDRVMQVLRNLVNNAVKFCKAECKIRVSTELKDNMILFSVTDSGIGISKENQMKIFEPFFQAEQTIYRKHGGTGLGLAICRGIVESQGGKIWVESEKDKGSTFYFTIPLKPVKEIKPIRVLFSQRESIENKLRDIFKETLGPIGEKELEDFKNETRLTKENLLKYSDLLSNKGIIGKEETAEFKSNILVALGENQKQ